MLVRNSRLKHLPGLLLIFLYLANMPLLAYAAGNETEKVNELADRYYSFRLKTQPEVAYFSGVEVDRHDGLYDNSPEALAAEQAEENRLLAVTANPNGRACYEASLRSYTTLNRSAEEVYELGLQTVAANRKRVEELGKAAYGLDDFTTIMEKVKAKPRKCGGSRLSRSMARPAYFV